MHTTTLLVLGRLQCHTHVGAKVLDSMKRKMCPQKPLHSEQGSSLERVSSLARFIGRTRAEAQPPSSVRPICKQIGPRGG